MKKYLLIFISAISFAQGPGRFTNVQIQENTEDNTAKWVNVQTDSGIIKKILKSSLVPQQFTNIVYVNATSPTGSTIFDLNNPPVTNDNLLKATPTNLYIGTDGSTWNFNTLSGNYTTYTVPKSSNFNLAGTSIDAGNDKTSAIIRSGTIESTGFKKTGGTSTQSLQADGSVYDLNLKANNSDKGIANGIASLDTNGKVPLSQVNDALLGAVNYKGVYNASTNSPSLPDPTTNKGNYWIVSTAGTQFSLNLSIGDWIISNGVVYGKVDNNNNVTSVAGKVGAVTLVKADVGLTNVDNTTDLLKPISTATQTALNLKATDSNVMHLTGDETFTGVKSATNTGSSQINGFNLTNNGSGASSSIKISNASTGFGAFINNLNQGNGLYLNNVSTGVGFYVANTNFGNAIYLSNSSTGVGLNMQNVSSGKGFYIANNSSGDAIVANNLGSGFSFIGQNTSTNTFTVDKLGAVTGTSFIKSGATTTDALLAGGGTLSNPITGTGTSGYISKFTGSNSLGNSLVYDNGTSLGIGTTSPNRALCVKSGDLEQLILESTVNQSGIFFVAANTTYSPFFGATGNDLIARGNSGAETFRITSSGEIKASGLIFPQQASTAPTYVKGAIYFDTTLNKLRVGGASGWETINSL